MSKLKMRGITDKSVTRRQAQAKGEVILSPATVNLIREGKIPKGDVLSCAQVAAVMGVKKTPSLIPLCHPLRITEVRVSFELKEERIEIEVEVEARDRTGVEMEALTGLTVAALSIYDMCKGVDKGMLLSNMRLVKKRGGESGDFIREEEDEGKNNLR